MPRYSSVPADARGLSRFGSLGEGKPVTASEDLKNLVSEAFFYGYPLVADLDEVVRFTETGMGSVPAAPFNQFSHARTLAGPADTFVTINNDTLYSIAQFDLSGGPLFLDVPNSAGRYYVLQFIDAWTNNFAYVGERASGTQAGTFFLTPPGWTGEVPDDFTEIRFPTRVASILGRWACSGAEDLAAVHALQDKLVLRPASDARGCLEGVPLPTPDTDESLAFFEKLRSGWQPSRRGQRISPTRSDSAHWGCSTPRLPTWILRPALPNR